MMNYSKAVPIKPGYAELVFTNANFSQSTVFVSIQRKGHQASHLGGKGWQVSEHTFQLAARSENNELRIEVGKRIVGYLEGNSNYEFLVGQTSDNKMAHIVRWSGVPDYRLSEDDDDGPAIEPTPQPIIVNPRSQDPVEPQLPKPIPPELPKPVPPEPPKPIQPGTGPIKLFCSNGHAVLSTFKKCPICAVAIDPQPPVIGNPTSTVASPLIQPAPIMPTVINAPKVVTPPVSAPITPVPLAAGASRTFCGNCGKPVLSTMIKCPSCGQPTGVKPSVGQVSAPQSSSMNTISSGSQSSYQPNPQIVLASRWARLGASIIDNWIIGYTIFWLVWKFVFAAEYADTFSDEPLDPEGSIAVIPIVGLIHFCIMTLYHSILNSSDDSGTFGKMICGIRVRDYQGQQISFGTSLGRTLLTLMPIVSLGMFVIFFNDKRQTLADKVCKTLVIKKG
jgi:uncharacterized RDD family membrane protein YckC